MSPGAPSRLRPETKGTGRVDVEDIQRRENRWVIADLRGKGGRIRTVAVPVWVKNGINKD